MTIKNSPVHHPDVIKILDDQSLSHAKKKELLQALYAEARDLQRAASESAMDADDGHNRLLRSVELALESLGVDTPDTGAATL